MVRFLMSALICTMSLMAFGQQGTVRGTLVDGNTGETIPFANVIIQGTTTGTSTDLDGNYNFNLDPGTYVLVYKFLGYQELIISDVQVVANEVTLLNASLEEESEVIQEVVITAKQARNTEAALLTIQRKSANLLDGVSSQLFKRTGDGDAGAAIKRVTGVSVEGGKHVYVRGLGDRYTKTILNGMDIPGLDPDRNSVQMDIFPASVVNNILVYKNFSPDLPGDFTGGLVNIETKEFPTERTMTAGVSFGFNPAMHLRSDFLSYEGGKTDIFGFDDGTRKLPISKFANIPDPVQGSSVLTSYTEFFNPIMSTQRVGNDLNKSLSFSYGDQKQLNDISIGYIAALNFKHEYEYYDDVQFGSAVKSQNAAVNILSKDKVSVGSLGIESSMWSALGGFSIKSKQHKASVNVLRIQNANSSAGLFTQEDLRENQAVIEKSNLEFQERSVTNITVKGKSTLSEGKFEIDWSFAPTFSEIDEPDIRYTGFEISDEGEYLIQPSVGATSSRTFRNLQEANYNGKVDLTYHLTVFGDRKSKIKVGSSYSYKDRDYEILNYLLRVRQPGLYDYTGNPNQLLETNNVWNNQTGTGTYLKGNFEPANSYSAQSDVFGVYVLNELPITKKLKAIYGARLEVANNYYTGQNNSGSVVYDKEHVLDEMDVLPSLNLIYAVSDQMNVRASASRTLARPSFKEKSIAQIQDRISGRSFIGNLDLEQTYINNYDLRWEFFPRNGELVSVSSFFKQFSNPIELVAFAASSPNDFQPINVGDANVLGLELELRKRLDFISESLNRLSFNTNITLVNSSVEMDIDEYNSRVANARDGQTVDRTREMVGQSPFVVNAGLNYRDTESGLELTVSYNVQGKRLAIVGFGRNPDVYQLPFHDMNAKVSYNFGNNDQYSLNLSASNILNSDKTKQYESFEATSGIFEMMRPNRTFKLGFNYRLR